MMGGLFRFNGMVSFGSSLLIDAASDAMRQGEQQGERPKTKTWLRKAGGGRHAMTKLVHNATAKKGRGGESGQGKVNTGSQASPSVRLCGQTGRLTETDLVMTGADDGAHPMKNSPRSSGWCTCWLGSNKHWSRGRSFLGTWMAGKNSVEGKTRVGSGQQNIQVKGRERNETPNEREKGVRHMITVQLLCLCG